MAYTNKIFIAFDASGVEHFKMMRNWKVSRQSFNFHFANINYVRHSTTEEDAKNQLMAQMNYSGL